MAEAESSNTETVCLKLFDAIKCMTCEIYDNKKYFNKNPGAIYVFIKTKDISDIKKF